MYKTRQDLETYIPTLSNILLKMLAYGKSLRNVFSWRASLIGSEDMAMLGVRLAHWWILQRGGASTGRVCYQQGIIVQCITDRAE